MNLHSPIEMTRTALRVLLAAGFVFAGAMHFRATNAYVGVMPSYFPQPRLLVYISGVCEILGGVGVLFAQPLRGLAGWGLILLLIAVFPVNIQMALQGATIGKIYVSPLLGWIRLPLQAALILWVWWCAVARAPGRIS